MVSVRTYGFINAKVRAMRSMLLTESIYRSLIACRDVKEFLSLLSQTHFRKLAERLEYPDPINVERELFLEEVNQLHTIEKFCKGDIKKFVLLVLERYDVEKLKVLLRLWHRKLNIDSTVIREKIVYDIPVNAIISAEGVEEISVLLADTPFGEVLETVAEEYKERKTLFPLELAIEKDMFRRIIEITELMNRRDRRIVRRLVGIEIDLKNLDWIGRFKKYYKLSSAEIIRYLLPYGYRLRSNEIRRVVTSENISEAVLSVIRGMNIFFPEEQEGELALDAIEQFLYHVLLSEARQAFKEFPFSIGSIIGYFYLMRLETKNIRTILHSKKYDLSSEQTEARIVL